jgi:hypothetical protein
MLCRGALAIKRQNDYIRMEVARLKQLEKNRSPPYRPAVTAHEIPVVTIEKLADAIYWIGRTAVQGQAETEPAKLRANLALIEQQAEAALAGDD